MSKAKKVVQFNNNNFPKFEKNIPCPPPRQAQVWSWVDSLKAGESFLLDDKRYSKSASTNVRSYIAKYWPLWEITVRTVEGGQRVWRIK